VERTGIEPV